MKQLNTLTPQSVRINALPYFIEAKTLTPLGLLEHPTVLIKKEGPHHGCGRGQ